MGNQQLAAEQSSSPKGPVEEWIERIAQVPGVKGVIITDPEGLPLRDTFATWESAYMLQYATLCSQYISRAKAAISTLDSKDELSMVRIRSNKDEIMLVLDKDYLLIVVQAVGISQTDLPATLLV
eukprot:TRINITY_DN3599_c0_g1_i1.p1 TRINITY_DN3599_c0_g1~~TRINITY_DN3599_c0_g1_i1.p1  ORF type:complete len:125 (-),score=35.32 TRINITY_DN3599_c0_g1_i1:139-513(-)